VLGHLDQPRQDGIGIDLKHPGHGTHAQAFRQRAPRPHELLGRHALAMQRGAMGLLEGAATAGAWQLPPRFTARMTIRADIPPSQPAVVGARIIGAEVLVGIDGASASPRERQERRR
jgi:hypothetical protein